MGTSGDSGSAGAGVAAAPVAAAVAPARRPTDASSGTPPRPLRAHDHAVNFASAVVSGAFVAVMFHPWDRALYLSVLRGSRFLTWNNFNRPFQGFGQTAIHRTLSNGSYFPLTDMFQQPVSDIVDRWQWNISARHRKELTAFAVGNLAGACNGVAFNWLTTIKYHAWKSDLSFEEARSRMFRKGGLRPFFNGICATVARDSVFGGVYALSKAVALDALPRTPSSTDRLCAGIGAGTLATVVSSPWNYARNIKYATSPAEPAPSTLSCIMRLWKDSMKMPHPMRHLQQKLRLGWGTARVGVGFAAGHEVYIRVREAVNGAIE